MHLISIRNLSDVCIEFRENGNVILHTTEMELAGSFIKSLAEFLDIDNLKVVRECLKSNLCICKAPIA